MTAKGKGGEMEDYRKMYTVLCCAIDDVIDDLSQIPKARQSLLHLQRALQQAEDIYIDTTVYCEDSSQTIHINVYWTILIIRNLALGLFQASVRHCQQHIKRRQSIVFFRGL